MKDTVAGLERERDFYFSKLRDIEMLLQQACEADPELEKDEGSLIKQVQAILYSTEVSCMPCKRAGQTLTICRRVLRYQPTTALLTIRRRSEKVDHD